MANNFVILRQWTSSLDSLGRYFRVECTYPLMPDELQDVLDLMEIVKRQLTRGVSPKDSSEKKEEV